jgi:pyruvate dehydrogenase E2 component (dihydrolipoamide acetyltransferase)
MGDFLMPSLGADMDHGKLVEWLVKPGDYVRRGDIMAVVDTDKTIMDVESFQEGVVADLLVDVGETVPVGTPLARITATPAETGHVIREQPTASPPAPPVRHLAHQLGVDTAKLKGSGKAGRITREDVEHAGSGGRTANRVRSSPRARRVASELGVDIQAVRGSGPGGAVTEADVHGYAGVQHQGPGLVSAATSPAGTTPEVEEETIQPLEARAKASERTDTLRRAIGALMSKSKKTIPHYYLAETLDLQAAIEWMESANLQLPVSSRLVPSALLLKAAAVAARDVPEVNGFYANGVFKPSTSVHLGVAVALRKGGLVAPAIHNADTLPLSVLMEQLRDLVGRARAGRLQRAEMADPTLTVTNLGELGVESVYGVIYPPQVAMVGFGKVTEQPWAHNGMLGIRHTTIATLSGDHRVSDGLRGARYLNKVSELLQRPEEL